MRTLLLPLTTILYMASPTWAADQPHPGEKAFQMNCMACHQVQTGLVGPSLVEMSKLYPLTNESQFLEWTKNPGQKRQGAIEMPSMAHLGDDVLRDVHKYILLKAEGKKEIKPKKTDPFKDSPSYNKYPRVERLFIDGSGPASIAILPSKDIGAVWDAGQGRLRFISKSQFDAWGDWEKGGRGQGTFVGKVDYRETGDHLLSIAQDKVYDFKGYKLVNGLPVFRYHFGDVSLEESVTLHPQKDGIIRSFETSGLTAPLVLNLSSEGSAKVTVESGGVAKSISEEGLVTLSPGEAAAFNITVRP